jgi:glucarate dehydratase
MGALRISSVTVTPVAFADPPLLNSVGVHEPFALRAVVEVSTDDGLSGLGETYADERHLAALRAAADAIVGADAYGFTALKLKSGVFPPEQEAEAIRALRAAFGGHPPRLDPNAAWTPDTSVKVARDLDGVLEYLEDPTPGIDGMAQVARVAPMPLATNMCVVAFAHLPPAIRAGAVQVVLSDHHYWGGLRRSRLLAGICETFGLGLSMHSNSHLGISLAAMVHLAAATPNLTYACDTHWPWKTEDVVAGQPFGFRGGAIRVPDAPGLGVELDRDALARLHEQYLRCGLRNRDDTGYMRRVVPGYERRQPRW